MERAWTPKSAALPAQSRARRQPGKHDPRQHPRIRGTRQPVGPGQGYRVELDQAPTPRWTPTAHRRRNLRRRPGHRHHPLPRRAIGRLNRRGRLTWSLPKGHIENAETPEQAAIREVAEETLPHASHRRRTMRPGPRGHRSRLDPTHRPAPTTGLPRRTPPGTARPRPRPDLGSHGWQVWELGTVLLLARGPRVSGLLEGCRRIGRDRSGSRIWRGG